MEVSYSEEKASWANHGPRAPMTSNNLHNTECIWCNHMSAYKAKTLAYTLHTGEKGLTEWDGYGQEK